MRDQAIIDALRAERQKIRDALAEIDILLNAAAFNFSLHAEHRHCGTTYQPHSPHGWHDDGQDYYCPAGRP